MSERIQAIADAATTLFITQGYSKTQISHIAQAVGISVGTIYHDFIGKKEIAFYILKCTIDSTFVHKKIDRPIGSELFIGLEQEIAEVFSKSARDFEKHLIGSLEDYSFEMLISDAFDLLSCYGIGCLFIEKNLYDFKFLAEQYKSYRKSFFSMMTNYIHAFIAHDRIRKVDNVNLTTMLIIEILSWWTMDIRYTSFETQDIPLAAAKNVCMDNIISAYRK